MIDLRLPFPNLMKSHMIQACSSAISFSLIALALLKALLVIG